MGQRKSKRDQANTQSELWLIKSETEQVKGPYSTDAVSKMILEGIYNGQEQIASYPEGDWRELAKQPEFYETLLESLENPIERDEKKAQKMDAETVIRTMPVKSQSPGDKADKSDEVNLSFASELEKAIHQNVAEAKSIAPKGLKPVATNEVSSSSLIQKQMRQFQIEKERIDFERKKILKKFLPFLAFVITLAAVGLFLFTSDNSRSKSSWALLTPDFKKSEIDASELKSLKVKAVGFLKGGVLDDLIKAQNVLVQAVEGKNNDLESLGLLCVVHHSMWPYTKQVSNDLKAISVVTRQARSVNAISSYADACQAFQLQAKGQINDGRALLERALDQNTEKNFVLYPFLYLNKGELLEESGNLVNAEVYYREALKQFPDWNRAEYSIGRVLLRQGKYQQAADVFKSTLAKSEKYKPALYGLGLSLNKLNNDQSGQAYLEQGYAIKQIIPKDLNLEALQEYANILVNKNDTKKALEVVQSGLKVSPSHRALKDLFISLGGESLAIGDAQVTELILEGDQFFRLGDYLAAQGRYRAAFDNDQKNTLLALKIAKSMRALNQFRESISWIDTALKIDPKMLAAYSLKAEYFIQRYNFVDAQNTLLAAQRIDPNNYEILKSLARLEWKKNNLTHALQLGTRAYKQFNVDVELITLLSTINVEIYFRPGRAGADNDQEKKTALEEAQKYAARAVDLEPAWPESQIAYAKYLYAKEGSQASERYYKELIKSFPYSLEYQFALAEFYERLEKNIAAEEIYRTIVEIDPKSKEANLGLARSYRSRNDFNNAIKYFMIGATLDPSDVESLFSVGMLQLDRGETTTNSKESTKLLGEALARFELVKKNNLHYPKVYYFTAKAKLALGYYDEAMQDLNTEKTKNPSLADPYILSAEINQKQNQFSQCAQNYMTVIKLRPTSEYYFKAAACYRLAGSLDLAEDMIIEGHSRESGNYVYYRELGYLHEAKGDTASARKNFEIYLDLTAHNSFDAKLIENKLRSGL